MSGEREVGIVVTHHAAERWMARHPEAHRSRDAVAAIFHHVQEAFRAGRVSKRKPSWSQFVNRRSGDDRNRYCWTEDEQVAFVLAPHRDAHDVTAEQIAKGKRYRKRWVVLTCLPRQDATEDDVARRHLTRASIQHQRGQSSAGRRAGRGNRRRRLDSDHHG